MHEFEGVDDCSRSITLPNLPKLVLHADQCANLRECIVIRENMWAGGLALSKGSVWGGVKRVSAD